VHNASMYEHLTTGIFHRQLTSRMAVYKLQNGTRCLVDLGRIWAGSDRFKGSWTDMHCSLNIRARPASCLNHFTFQAIFAHFGFTARDPRSRKFLYHTNSRIQSWIHEMDNEKDLEIEFSAAKDVIKKL